MIHSNDALQWCNTYKWFISKVGEPPCGRCRPAAEAPPVRFAYSPFTSVWCSNILSIPQLSLRLIESENQTVWRAASCSNRGQVVRRCHLKAALMVSVKVNPHPHPLQQAPQRSKPARCVEAVPWGPCGSCLAGALCWLHSATTCAPLAGEHLYLSGVHGLKRAFSIQTHSLAAGIPSALRNYNQLY